VTRLPNHNYYSDEWSNEPFVIPDSIIALNEKRIGSATPYSISPQIAAFTRKYSEKVQSEENYEASQFAQYEVDWQEEYREEKHLFVPQNRWTHEVVEPPINIKDNLYKINISADAYPHLKPFEHKYENSGTIIRGNEYKFITRTLYRYVDITKNFVNEKDLDDEWCPRIYVWKIRWLPQKPAKLTFFTNEDMVYWKSPETVIDTNDIPETEEGVVDVPVIFKRGIKSAMHYIKHDTTILYMKVDFYEEQ
jgi:hypothetical protein